MRTIGRMALVLLCGGGVGCDPLTLLVLNELRSDDETEHLVLVNEPDYFYRSADHNDFHTVDRTVTETYLLSLNGSATTVEASWETLTAGRIELTIRDAADVIVYTHLFAPGHPTPFADATAAGTPGIWKVTFAASALTSTKLEFRIYAP